MVQTVFLRVSHWFAHLLASTEVLWIAEWTGALLAIGGAFVMSMNRVWSRHAWAIWIASNVLLIAPIAYAQRWGLLMTQFAFLLVNINGLLRHRRRARPSPRRTTNSPRRAEGLRREPIHHGRHGRALSERQSCQMAPSHPAPSRRSPSTAAHLPPNDCKELHHDR